MLTKLYLLALAVLLAASCAPVGVTENGLHPDSDLALISSTGHPQFLVSYADW